MTSTGYYIDPKTGKRHDNGWAAKFFPANGPGSKYPAAQGKS